MTKKNALWGKLLEIPELTVLIPVIIGFIFGAVFNDKFLTLSNMVTLIRGITYTGMLALTMTLVITGKGMDMSVDSTAALASVLFALLVSEAGVHPVPAALIVLAAAALIGFSNSVLISRIGVPAFIATLGTQYIVKGIAVLFTGGGYVMIGYPFRIYSFKPLGLTIDVWIFILLAVIFSFVLKKLSFGRKVILLGTNQQAARIAGVKTVAVASLTYILNAMMAAFASILFTIRSDMGMSDAGTSWALQAIAASVIGGTNIYGGKGGSIPGTVLGVLFMGLITNLMMLFNIRAEWQNVGTGLCIVFGILAGVFRERLIVLYNKSIQKQ